MITETLEPKDRYVKRVVRSVDDCVTHHPWSALGWAAAFGLLVGLLIGGGNSKEPAEELQEGT